MSDDTLRVMCPNLTCRKILAVPSSARGKTVRCRGCGTSIRIPGLPKDKPAAAEGQPAAPAPTGSTPSAPKNAA
jgi:hypothetical protein